MRYPLALYGPKGWDDLTDMVTARNEAQEADARARGYKMLRETVEAASEPETAASDPLVINVTWDKPSTDGWREAPEPEKPAPKRRGRPPKAKPQE